MGPPRQDGALAATSSAEQQQTESSEPSRRSTGNRKRFETFGEPIPTNFLNKEGRIGWFQGNVKKLEVFFIKVSKTKEELT